VTGPLTITHASEPADALSAAHECDAWLGLSDDLIGRFLDVLATYGYQHAARRAYRAELHRFDRWMQRRTGRTLTTATEADLRTYLTQRGARRAFPTKAVSDALRRLRRFYAFLEGSHVRADNPLARAIDVAWGNKTELAGAAHFEARAHDGEIASARRSPPSG